MPLVDYASSDEESNGESEVTEKHEKIQEIQAEKKHPSGGEETKESAGDDELFSSLPKPKKVFSFLEDENKLSKLLLHKSSFCAGKKENVKITVPSISEFDNEAVEPPPKKIKPSVKGAGLFSVLPPPKNNSLKATNTSLVPHAVSQNHFKQTVSKSVAKSKDLIKKLTKGTGGNEDDDDDDDVSVGSSFFGSSLLEQSADSESVETNNESVSFIEPINNTIVSNNSFGGHITDPGPNSNLCLYVNVNEEQVIYSTNSSQEPEMATAEDNPLELDEKALQILCGNKKKRHQMPMNIIDLSSEEVLPDSKEWLLKQFTEEKKVRSHSHRKSHGPSSQSRRKHQITYLAYQAKEQELELKNQWANNRMSRKQTQSKYGF